MKFQPVKASNGVEGKTGMTADGGSAGRVGSKALRDCEGRKSLTRVTYDERKVDAVLTSCLTRQGRALRFRGNAETLVFSGQGSKAMLWRQIARVLVPGQIA